MGKLFGLILIVLCVWVGLEVYEKGVDHAFGGLFAWMAAPIGSEPSKAHGLGSRSSDAEKTEVRGSLAQRVGAHVREDIERGARRDSADDGEEQDND